MERTDKIIHLSIQLPNVQHDYPSTTSAHLSIVPRRYPQANHLRYPSTAINRLRIDQNRTKTYHEYPSLTVPFSWSILHP